MSNKKIFTLFILSVIIFIISISCSKENADPAANATTVDQDKRNITATFDDFYGCLNKLDDGDLSSFLLYSLFNNANQEYNDSYLNTLFNKFKSQYGQIVLNEKLQYATLTGIYTYNPATGMWSRTNSSNTITLKFPSVSTNPAIDSEMVLNSYSDTNTTYNGKVTWLPTAANLTLKRNNNTLFSISLTNIAFDVNTNFTMPINADIAIDRKSVV